MPKLVDIRTLTTTVALRFITVFCPCGRIDQFKLVDEGEMA
jgi:hypothetical protein